MKFNLSANALNLVQSKKFVGDRTVTISSINASLEWSKLIIFADNNSNVVVIMNISGLLIDWWIV